MLGNHQFFKASVSGMICGWSRASRSAGESRAHWEQRLLEPLGCWGFAMGKLGFWIINHPCFDGLEHPFVVKMGMVYYCFTNISC